MYVNKPQELLFDGLDGMDGLGAAGELPADQNESVGQEAVIPAGAELRFVVGSIFTVDDTSRIRYAAHKGCTPSTVFVFDGGSLFVRLTSPVSVGYGTDGNLRVASNADASGDVMARGELVGVVDPTGVDMVCNLPAVVSRPATVQVHGGAKIAAMLPPPGVTRTPIPVLDGLAAPKATGAVTLPSGSHVLLPAGTSLNVSVATSVDGGVAFVEQRGVSLLSAITVVLKQSVDAEYNVAGLADMPLVTLADAKIELGTGMRASDIATGRILESVRAGEGVLPIGTPVQQVDTVVSPPLRPLAGRPWYKRPAVYLAGGAVLATGLVLAYVLRRRSGLHGLGELSKPKYHGHSDIYRIVSRLHVGEPDEDVLKYVRSRFKKGAWEKLPAEDRFAIEHEALRVHHANQKLYRDVMRGGFGAIDPAVLPGFTGSESWTRYSPIFRNVLLTDGAKYVAEKGGGQGAYWLMDAIASHIPRAARRDPRLAEFQIWELKVNQKTRKATLTARADSGEKPAVTQRIPYTDFDQPSIKFYVEPTAVEGGRAAWVIMLPSEH